jgi:uncharacterized protein (TIGR03382 family)
MPWLQTTPSQAEGQLIVEDIPYPFVTRLRTSMRVEYLTEDLALVPAEDSAPVDNFMIAGSELNRPEPAPSNSDDGCQAGSLGRMNFMAFVGLAGLLALSRRRRHPRE